MKLDDILSAAGKYKARTRVGRGTGSGQGKTSGRGSKGYHSRPGSNRAFGFEGGQNPMLKRIPKRGFTNIHRIELTIVNLDRLAKLRKEEIRPKDMADHGLIKKETERVKILGRGDLASAKTIHAHEFSESAVKKIEAKGGRAVVIGKEPC